MNEFNLDDDLPVLLQFHKSCRNYGLAVSAREPRKESAPGLRKPMAVSLSAETIPVIAENGSGNPALGGLGRRLEAR